MSSNTHILSVIAALALLGAPALQGCAEAHAQSRRSRRARRDAAVVAVDAAEVPQTPVITTNSCPASLANLANRACTLPSTQHCFEGTTHCRCLPNDAGTASHWQCESAGQSAQP